MLSFPACVARQLAGAAFIALVVSGCSENHAQLAPTPAPPKQSAPQHVAYYVDGKLTTQTEVTKLDAATIQFMNVVQGAQAAQMGLAPNQESAVLITTKAKANAPEVIAFNRRFPVKPASYAENEAVAAVQTYLKQHYPAAKVETIFQAKNATDRYTAVFEDNSQRLQLQFDGKGKPVAQ